MTKLARKNPDQIWYYIFLFYAVAVLLFPVIFTKGASFFITEDNLQQAYPSYNKLAISLHKGYFPVWDANTFGGKSFVGDPQTGIFYLPNIIWCLLFGNDKGIETYYLDLLVCFHYLVCLLGMYKVARIFQLSDIGAIATSLIFTFAGAVGARAAGQTCIFFGLTLLPWSIYFIVKYYLVRRYKKYLAFSGLIAGLEILAGHMQPFFHTLLIGGIIILFYEYQSRKKWKSFFLSIAINALIVTVFAILVALPQIYYTAGYMSRSYRTVSGDVLIGPGQKVPLFIYSHWFVIELYNLVNFFGQPYAKPSDANILYMGILPFFLVITYLTWFRTKKTTPLHATLTKLLALILVIGFLSALGYRTYFYLVLYNIPFVNLIRQLGRYIILISFSASLLTGLSITYLSGLKEWLFQRENKIKSYLLCSLIIITLLGLFIWGNDFPPRVVIPYLLALLFFLVLRIVRMPPSPYLPFVACAVIFVDLLLNPVSYSPTRTYFYPAYFYKRNKIIDLLETTYGRYRVTFDMNNYYVLARRNLGDIYGIQTKNGYGATVNMAYYDFITSNQSPDSEINALLNVRYVITNKKLDSNFIFKDSTRQFKLYETKHWYPRCYWKRQLGQSGEKIESENNGTIHLLTYSDLYEKISVDCMVQDTLIFSENYYPGWMCLDNGKRVPIYTATIKNYPLLFRSIALDTGRHIIEFKYNNVFHWF